MFLDIIKIGLFAVYVFSDIKLMRFIIEQIFHIGIKLIL
jgi:hypothetical protein